MKSARINFGIPESEYIVQVDDTGAATSCYNQDTDTEYIGGSSVEVEALSVTENGTYSEEGKAYSPVTVNVEGDFITAEVTIKNASTAESAAELLIEFAPLPEENYVSGMFVDSEEGITTSPLSIENIPIGGEIKRTFYILDGNKIVAYDEVDYAFLTLISVEGAANIATDAAGRYIEIFGNCTINLTSAPK